MYYKPYSIQMFLTLDEKFLNQVNKWISLCLSEYIVLHTPKSISLRATDKAISHSDIPRVISSLFGFTLDKDLEWDGLNEKNLFERPQANVLISLPGYKSISPATKMGTSFKTIDNTPAISYDSITYKMRRTIAKPTILDFAVDNGVMDIRSQSPQIFSEVVDVEGSDLDKEIQGVQQILKSLKNNKQILTDNQPDFYHFSLSSLAAHPAQLRSLLEDTVQGFRDLYNDDVMIHLVTLPKATPVHVRKARSLLENKKDGKKSESFAYRYNIAFRYSNDFPIMFNIILWTMVGFTLTIFAISYGTWFMDPGRDSIIYRMTSQRLKSD